MINDITDYIKSATKEDRLRVGKEYENFVADLIEDKCGGIVTHANEKTDMRDHIDLWWDSPKGGIISIDVKGPKRFNKHDTAFDTNCIWVELQNIRGRLGWVYGKEDVVAFIINKSVVFVKREKLAKLVENNIKDDTIYTKLYKNDIYKKYQRDGVAKDIIVRVPVKDIYNITWFTINF